MGGWGWGVEECLGEGGGAVTQGDINMMSA